MKVITNAELNFEKIKDIGAEGKNSDVFLAHDKQFDANIVVKQVNKKTFTSPDEFYQETKCLYKSKHQNIVEVHYSCEDSDNVYIAMPHYKNGSLESLIKKRILTVREIIKYSLDFISGLNHIHTLGLVHFDIKPTNILISDSNEALVTDFGLAKHTTSGLAEQDLFYTLHTPPESLKTNKFNIQADIYQAGLTIYRLCNGSNLFKNQLKGIGSVAELHNRISKGIFPDRKYFYPHIPQKLREIIRKAIEINPNDRYSSFIEMLNDLSKINENLDWNLKVLPGGTHVWSLDANNKFYHVTLSKNPDNTNKIETTKTMKSSGNKTIEHSNCEKNISNAKMDARLKKILKSY